MSTDSLLYDTALLGVPLAINIEKSPTMQQPWQCHWRLVSRTLILYCNSLYDILYGWVHNGICVWLRVRLDKRNLHEQFVVNEL